MMKKEGDTFMPEDIYKNVTSPPKSSGLLSRPRLNDLLSKAARQNLVPVIAGAGYGKTQAVSMFLNDNNYRIAWLQLSKLDNYPERFWGGFIYALSLQNSDVSTALGGFNFPESLSGFDQFLHLFVKEIYNGNPFIFVFDDFHLIHNESVINFIENLVAANIEDFCIILLSRTNIPFAVNAKYYFTEKDLRFTIAETDEYFKIQGILLTESETKKVNDYTKGWPLALYLVGLELKKDSRLWVNRLSDTKLTIFQMIEKDIFSTYPPLLQEFLTKLSLLEEFPSALIYELSGEHIITVIDMFHTNMFIDYNLYNRKYRFHPIFLEFLQEKQIYLKQQDADEFYLIAAKWYDANEFKNDAMICYEKCGHYDDLWKIIFHMPPYRYPKSTAALMIHYLDGFPNSFISKNPLIRVYRAAFLLNNLELESAAEDLLALVKEMQLLPESKDYQAVIGEAYIVLAMIRLTQKDHSYVDYFKMADACLPEGSIRDYSQTKIIDSNNAVNLICLEKNELEKLQENLFEAIPYASRVMNGFGYGSEYFLTAETAYYKGNMKKAQKYAFEALYRGKQKNQEDIICNAYFLLIKITAAKGDYNATMNYMKYLKEYVKAATNSLSILDIAESWFFIRIGKSENIARWLLDDLLNTETYPPISVGRDRLIRAYYFLEERQYDELLAFSRQLDSLYQEKGLWPDLLSIRTMRALALYYTGDISQCSTILQSLYELVSEIHFIMQFVEMGSHMCGMIDNIRRSANYNIPDKWLNNIYSKSSTYAKRQAFYKKKYNTKNRSEIAERFRLSNREKEILINLCQGLTREEIAESLYISVNTVKSTLQRIYNKLDAVNSADAVRIAAQMKII